MKNLQLFLTALLVTLSAINGRWGECIAWSFVFYRELQVGRLKKQLSEKANHV